MPRRGEQDANERQAEAALAETAAQQAVMMRNESAAHVRRTEAEAAGDEDAALVQRPEAHAEAIENVRTCRGQRRRRRATN